MDYTDVHKGKNVKGKDGNRFWRNTPIAWELYDLEKDPKEMVNQYLNPEYSEVVKELKELLLKTRNDIGDTDDEFPIIKEIFTKNL